MVLPPLEGWGGLFKSHLDLYDSTPSFFLPPFGRVGVGWVGEVFYLNYFNMKNIKNIIALCCFFFFVMTTTNAQNYYIRLSDASGINTDPYQVELEAAAKDLVLAMPKEVQDSFKVFDLGSYLLQEKTDSTYLGFFNLAKKKAATLSKYYLLIGKKSTTEGVFTDFEVDLELPHWGKFACVASQKINWKKNLLSKLQPNLFAITKDGGTYNTENYKKLFKTLQDYLYSEVKYCSGSKGEVGMVYTFTDIFIGKKEGRSGIEYPLVMYFRDKLSYALLNFKEKVEFDTAHQVLTYKGKKYAILSNYHKDSMNSGQYKLLGLYDYDYTVSIYSQFIITPDPDFPKTSTIASNFFKIVDPSKVLDKSEYEIVEEGISPKSVLPFRENLDLRKDLTTEQKKILIGIMTEKDQFGFIKFNQSVIFEMIEELSIAQNACGGKLISFNYPLNSVSKVCWDYVIDKLKALTKLNSDDPLIVKLIDRIDNGTNQPYLTKFLVDSLTPYHYKVLKVEQRRKILSFTVNQGFLNPVLQPWSINQLSPVTLKILKYAPEKQAEEVIDMLNKKPLQFAQISNKHDKHSLIYYLEDGMSDSFIGVGDDNYTKLVVELGNLLMRGLDLGSKIDDVIHNYPKERYISLYPKVKGMITPENVAWDGDNITWTLKEMNGYLEYKVKNETRFDEQFIKIDAIPAVTVKPTDLIILKIQDNIPIYNDDAQYNPKKILFVPAIFLKYAKHKQENKIAETTLLVSLDILSLACPLSTTAIFATEVLQASKIGKAIAYMAYFGERATYIANIADHTIGITNPFAKDLLAASNLIIGGFALGQMCNTLSSGGAAIKYSRATNGQVSKAAKSFAAKNYTYQYKDFSAVKHALRQLKADEPAFDYFLKKATITGEQHKAFKDAQKVIWDIVKTHHPEVVTELTTELEVLNNQIFRIKKFETLAEGFSGLKSGENLGFLKTIEKLSDKELPLLNQFFEEFKALATQDEQLAFIKNLIVNSKNNAWLSWVLSGRPIVPELRTSILEHIYHGEIRIKFKDGITPDFVATPENIWAELQAKFMSDDAFADALLKTDNLGKQTFTGLHSFDEIEKLSNTILPTSEKLLTYSSKKTFITLSNGKIAYEVFDPLVFIPDLSNLKSINKGKSLSNRVWTTQGQTISKKLGISSCYFEGMSKDAVAKMISESFLTKKPVLGNKWESNMNYLNTAFKIEMRIDDNGFISTNYLIK